MRAALVIAALSLLGHCRDETVTGHGGAGTLWRLESIDGTPFPARATLAFPEEGSLAGEAPCNRYSGLQEAPYPWFAARRIVSTRRACPDLASETLYFAALAEMTLVEIAGPVLILSNDGGREMVFHAAPGE